MWERGLERSLAPFVLSVRRHSSRLGALCMFVGVTLVLSQLAGAALALLGPSEALTPVARMPELLRETAPIEHRGPPVSRRSRGASRVSSLPPSSSVHGVLPADLSPRSAAREDGGRSLPFVVSATPAPQGAEAGRPASAASVPGLAPVDPAPPRRLIVPSIDLDVEVVEAPVIQREEGPSWWVPQFVVGHAQGTPNPGERGNVVLLGHVTSQRAGKVFARLHEVRPSDVVLLDTEQGRYRYRVRSVERLPRTAVGVLRDRGGSTVSLITCAGEWMPLERDYAERLVVLADLETVEPRPANEG